MRQERAVQTWQQRTERASGCDKAVSWTVLWKGYISDCQGGLGRSLFLKANNEIAIKHKLKGVSGPFKVRVKG